jgi:hypothetical protein
MFVNHPYYYGQPLLTPLGPASIPPTSAPLGVVVASIVPHRPQAFAPTSLSLPSEYDYAGRPERIVVRRRDLERSLRATIEESMCMGGRITTLARSCMEALDREEQKDADSAVENEDGIVYI